MKQILKSLTRGEWVLWLGSMVAVTLCAFLSGKPDALTLVAACVGVTSLVLAAKGHVWAQFLMIAFSILYGVISFRFRYWGEMMTYLGMSLPMAVWSAIAWIKHPSAGDAAQVAIRTLRGRHFAAVFAAGAVVTGGFYFVLRALDTPNLFFSTISVTTSFLAAAKDATYLAVAANFTIFFLNDMYGFFSWKKRERAALS